MNLCTFYLLTVVRLVKVSGNVVDVEACTVQVHLARLWQRIQHVPRCRETRSTRSSWVRSTSVLAVFEIVISA